MDILKKIQQFFSYCYLRYSLATELYMLEPWEKVVVHIIFIKMFMVFWFFNLRFLVSVIGQLRPMATFTEIVN